MAPKSAYEREVKLPTMVAFTSLSNQQQEDMKKTVRAAGIGADLPFEESADWDRLKTSLDYLLSSGISGDSTRFSRYRLDRFFNRLGRWLSDEEFLEATFRDESGDYRVDLRALMRAKFPGVEPKRIKQVVSLALQTKPVDHAEHNLFHLVALNDFIARAAGTDLSFGDYLKDDVNFDSINEQYTTFSFTSGKFTDKLFDAAYMSVTHAYMTNFALWYQGAAGTKKQLFALTADQYITLLDRPDFVNLLSSPEKASQKVRRLIESLANHGVETPTVVEMEVKVIQIMGRTSMKMNTETHHPLTVMAEISAQMEYMLDRTDCRFNGQNNPPTGGFIDSRTLNAVLTFLLDNSDEFTFDEAAGVLIALITKGSLVKTGRFDDSAILVKKVVDSQSRQRAVMFCRFVARMVTKLKSPRPTLKEWGNILTSPEFMDLDPSFSIPLVLNTDGNGLDARMRKWQHMFS